MSDDTNCGLKRPNSLLGLTIGFLDLIILLASVTHLASDPKARKNPTRSMGPKRTLLLGGGKQPNLCS